MIKTKLVKQEQGRLYYEVYNKGVLREVHMFNEGGKIEFTSTTRIAKF